MAGEVFPLVAIDGATVVAVEDRVEGMRRAEVLRGEHMRDEAGEDAKEEQPDSVRHGGREVAQHDGAEGSDEQGDGEVRNPPHHGPIPTLELERVMRLPRAVQVAMPKGGANGAATVVEEGRIIIRADN